MKKKIQKFDIFLGDKLGINISPRKSQVPQFLGDKLDINISPRKSQVPKFIEDKLV